MAIRIVAFNLFGTLLSLDALRAAVRAHTPMADAMVDAWRQRQLQLANAATSTARYVDFDRITLLALNEIAPRFHLRLDSAEQKRLIDTWAELTAFSDVRRALDHLRNRRLPAVVLTNAVASTARNALGYAEIGDAFSEVFSADAVHLFKPHRSVYDQLLQLDVAADEVLYVSANGWDVTGARQADFRTVWLNRRGGGLAPRRDRTIATLAELAAILDDHVLAN